MAKNFDPMTVVICALTAYLLYCAVQAVRERYEPKSVLEMVKPKLKTQKSLDIDDNMYVTGCKKKYSSIPPKLRGSKQMCRLGYYYYDRIDERCKPGKVRGVCVRINPVPDTKHKFAVTTRKKRLRGIKANDKTGAEYCSKNKRARPGRKYKMTKIKKKPFGRRRYYCETEMINTKPATGDTRVAYVKGCRFKGAGKVGTQGKCRDGYIINSVYRGSCKAPGTKKTLCEPKDYDMSVYPVKIPGLVLESGPPPTATTPISTAAPKSESESGSESESESEPEMTQVDSDGGNSDNESDFF